MKEKLISYLELYEAYLDCRVHKRNTINALSFELDLENNLLDLLNDINNRTYQIGRSVSFIINKPVKREIFAADFRDRVVHHLVINKINWIFERMFIRDSYSCREKKGTSYAISRLTHFIRSCSQNFSKSCYILHLDIQGFFMHINRNLLWEKVKDAVEENYKEQDKGIILYLCKCIIQNDPTINCIIKGSKSEWNGLPTNKSLFYSRKDCGLPIGNLTSQVFANLYLNDLDHFAKHTLGLRYYGRYVDDFFVVHSDKEYLKETIQKFRLFLSENLELTLHPNKIYLQPIEKGVLYLGVWIYPYNRVVHNRTINNLKSNLIEWNKCVSRRKPQKEEIDKFISSINSYFGYLRNCDSYKLRRKAFYKWMSGYWLNFICSSGGFSKLRIR